MIPLLLRFHYYYYNHNHISILLYRRYNNCSWWYYRSSSSTTRQLSYTTAKATIISINNHVNTSATGTSTSRCMLSSNSSSNSISISISTTQYNKNNSNSNDNSSSNDTSKVRGIWKRIQVQANMSIDKLHSINIRALRYQREQQQQQKFNDDNKLLNNDDIKKHIQKEEEEEEIYLDPFRVALGTLRRYRDGISPLYETTIQSIHNIQQQQQEQQQQQYTQTISLFEEYRRYTKLVYDAVEKSILILEKTGIVASYPSTKNKVYSIRNTMIELYGSIGCIDLVEEIFQKNFETTTTIEEANGQMSVDVIKGMLLPNNHNTPQSLSVLIQAYGKCQLTHRAEGMVQQLLHHLDSPTNNTTAPARINIITINTLLNCIAESDTPFETIKTTLTNKRQINSHIPITTKETTTSTPSQWDRGYDLINYIKSSSYCQQNYIHPNVVTYAVLLKCLCSTLRSTKKRYSDNVNEINDTVRTKVDTILNEAYKRYLIQKDKECQPNAALYAVAIKALFLANDYPHAKTLLHRMEEHVTGSSSSSDNKKIDLRPNAVIYLQFLNYYARTTSSDSAKRAETLLNHIRRISQQATAKRKDVEVTKPDSRMYSIVIKLWIESNDPKTTTYIWSLYEQMTSEYDNLVPSYDTLMKLVNSLSSSKTLVDKRRTVQLLSQNKYKFLRYDDGTMYLIAIQNLISQQDNMFTPEVIKLYVESYMTSYENKSFPNKRRRSSRSIFNYVITSYITNNNYTSATLFLYYILLSATKAVTTKSSDNLATCDLTDVAWIGPDLNVALDLRKGWDQQPHFDNKEIIINQFDNFIIPTLVRFVNIEKENIITTTGKTVEAV